MSLVDASNPVVFVRAQDVGMTGTESPATLDADDALMNRLEKIRRAAAVAMNIAVTPADALLSTPKIAVVAAAQDFTSLDGRAHAGSRHDIAVRLVSMGNFHRAITLTGGMCVAVAAGIEGTLVNQLTQYKDVVRIGNPSGVLPVKANVRRQDGVYEAVSVTAFRTQRRIMDGRVFFPADLIEIAPPPRNSV